MTNILSENSKADASDRKRIRRSAPEGWLIKLNTLIGLELASELKDCAVERSVRVTSWSIALLGFLAIGLNAFQRGEIDPTSLTQALVLLIISFIPFLIHWTGMVYIGAFLLCVSSLLSITLHAGADGGLFHPLSPMIILPAFWGWLFFSFRGSLTIALMTLGALAYLTFKGSIWTGDPLAVGYLNLSAPVSFGTSTALVIIFAILSGMVSWLYARKYELDLITRRDEALRINRNRSSFIAGIAHEVRTPMTGLMGMLELLANEDLNTNQKEMAQTARSSARNILNLINDLLDLSKIEIGELRLLPEPADVTDIFRNTVGEYRQRAMEKGVHLHITAPEDSCWLLIDPTRFRQCVSNFLSNAVKFTDQGFIHARLTCEDMNSGEVRVVLTVEDTGPGIPASLQNRIFARFVQVDGTQRSEHGGTGLGLAIVSDLAHLQGGTAWVESEEGIGSTFCFEASFKRTSPLDLPTGTLVTEHFGEMTILIADDSLGNQRVLTRVLQRLGYKTLSAENGSDALLLMLDNPVDLVLMDMNMPIKDGPTTLKDIRAFPDSRRDTPVIGLSADSSDADMDRWREAGVDGFIQKPVDFAALDLTIRRVLGVQRQGLADHMDEALPKAASK